MSWNANYKEEFCDFDNGEAFEKLLNALSEYGWRDNSWHNDSKPCIIFNEKDEFPLIIWVDYKDPKKSEFAEERKAGSAKQFMFCERSEDGDYLEEWHYDDVNRLIAYVEKVMRD